MITRYLQWRSHERQKDREVIIEAISMLKSAFDAQKEQAAAFKEFMDSFKIGPAPEIREWDEAASVQRYLESRPELPAELRGLPAAEQFERLLMRMEEP